MKISAKYKNRLLAAAAMVTLFIACASMAAQVALEMPQDKMVLSVWPDATSPQPFGQIPAAPPEKTVQNVWVDVPLTQVFRDISAQAGAVIAVCPHVPDMLISFDAGQPKPLHGCLKELVTGRGLIIFKKNKDFYLVSCGNPSCPSFMEVADSQRIYLKYINAKGLLSSLPRPIQPYVSCGERTNEVLVYAADDVAENIKDIVSKIDIPQQQVVLEVLVVELDENASEEFGVDWAYQDEHLNFSNKEGLGHFTSIARYTSVPENDMTDLLFVLRALVAKEKAAIRARPRVATLNGQPASIDITLDEYFTIVTDAYGPTALLRTELQVIKTGVILSIIPNIGENGDITVDVLTEVSDVAARQNEIQGNKAGDLPIVKRRKASTKVRVKDGDAIVIGGLVETQQKNVDKRVPILSSIPLVGGIFTAKESISMNKEVVIFITPRIMQEGKTPFAGRNQKINVPQELKQMREEENSQTDPNAVVDKDLKLNLANNKKAR